MSNAISLSRLVAPFLFAFGLSVSLGCGSKVEERLNCLAVFNGYEDCVDSDYDTRDRIQRCSQSVFLCGTECASIVP